MIKIVNWETAAKCRVYLNSTRVPCVTLQDKKELYRCWHIDALDIPLLKAWPKVTWIAVDRAVMKALRNDEPLPEKMLERLGMELVLSNGCPTPVLTAYLEYWNATSNNWGKAPV
jgi:hypothetical protein